MKVPPVAEKILGRTRKAESARGRLWDCGLLVVDTTKIMRTIYTERKVVRLAHAQRDRKMRLEGKRVWWEYVEGSTFKQC